MVNSNSIHGVFRADDFFLSLYICGVVRFLSTSKNLKHAQSFCRCDVGIIVYCICMFRCKSIVRSEKGYVLHSDFYLAVNQVLYTYIKITDYTQADEENVSLYLTLTTHEPFLFDGIEPYEHKVITMCDADTSREADIIRNNKNIYIPTMPYAIYCTITARAMIFKTPSL